MASYTYTHWKSSIKLHLSETMPIFKLLNGLARLFLHVFYNLTTPPRCDNWIFAYTSQIFPREDIAALTLESLQMSIPAHPGIMSNAHTFTQQVMIENLPRFCVCHCTRINICQSVIILVNNTMKVTYFNMSYNTAFKLTMNKYNINNFSVDVTHCMRAIFMIICHDNLWFGLQFGPQFHRWCSLTIYW